MVFWLVAWNVPIMKKKLYHVSHLNLKKKGRLPGREVVNQQHLGARRERTRRWELQWCLCWRLDAISVRQRWWWRRTRRSCRACSMVRRHGVEAVEALDGAEQHDLAVARAQLKASRGGRGAPRGINKNECTASATHGTMEMNMKFE